MSVIDPIVARNPATGDEIARFDPTPPAGVADRMSRLCVAQPVWRDLGWRGRLPRLKRLHAVIARDADAWADLIRTEIGKPRGEAMADVVSTLDALKWTIREGGRALRPRRAGPSWQRWMLLGPATVDFPPLGVVGLIGTWNYPLLLNAAPLAQAIAAGNAVIWKPSELATACGMKLDAALREAGFGEVLATVVGGPEVGRALVESGIDKGHFTGGVAAGRAVAAGLAARGAAAAVELSGYDAAIVLPDADLGHTVPALTWAAFVGAGQTCVAIKRILVVGDARPWAETLASSARALRVGDPGSDAVDVGPLINPASRDRFDGYVRGAVAAGARVLAGAGAIAGPGAFYAPTVLGADDPAPEHALAGAFGPVVLVRAVRTPDEAVAAVNASPFGLAASLWGRNRRALRALAARLDVGMVTINDAVTPAGHAAAPFGGVRDSGYGRTRGAFGLHEFVQPRATHARRPGGLRPHIFPYGSRLERLLAFYRKICHGRS